MNSYFARSNKPATSSVPLSSEFRAEAISIQQAFDKLPLFDSNALKPVRTNAAGSALEVVTPATLRQALGFRVFRTTEDEVFTGPGFALPAELGSISLEANGRYMFDFIGAFSAADGATVTINPGFVIFPGGTAYSIGQQATEGEDLVGDSAQATEIGWLFDGDTSDPSVVRGRAYHDVGATAALAVFGFNFSGTLYAGATVIVRKLN